MLQKSLRAFFSKTCGAFSIISSIDLNFFGGGDGDGDSRRAAEVRWRNEPLKRTSFPIVGAAADEEVAVAMGIRIGSKLCKCFEDRIGIQKNVLPLSSEKRTAGGEW